MFMMMYINVVRIFSFIIFFLFFPFSLADFRVGFYNATCPNAESIVQSVVAKHFAADPSVPAALLRMYFHDCFVRGCDASILIAPTKKKPTERSAGPNQTVRGFDIIDEAKSSLEAQCPGNVSCADIIVLAVRDAVALAGGPKYDVPTGRLDGLISNPNDVNLPGPQLTVSQALTFFTNKGFTLDDMVVLLGGHTVGVAHCAFFRDRLSNFQGTGQPDPTMNQALLAKLNETCGPWAKPLKSDPTAFLDQNTSFAVDNSYYSQIVQKRGVMQIDQELADDDSTAATVQGLAADAAGFARRFADALVRLGSVEIKQGSDGEIRRNCQAFNTPSTKP